MKSDVSLCPGPSQATAAYLTGSMEEDPGVQ